MLEEQLLDIIGRIL